MTVYRIIAGLGGLALAGAIFWAVGADDRGLGPVIQEMLGEPWSVVTLIDLYLGFFIIAGVIFFFERNVFAKLFWTLPIFGLGNVWAALWLVWRSPALIRALRARAA
ncbi:MAG: DUF1475 family protein [Pseudomonadota bacterium]